MDLKTTREKLLHFLMTVAAVLAFVVGLVPDLTAALTALLPFLPTGSKVYLVIGFVLALLARLPRVLPKVEELIAKLKATGPSALLMLVALNLCGCAWYQRNAKVINCAAIATVENAPALVGIVSGCATVAVSVEAIIPCVQAAANSRWAADVVACFSGDAAGLTSCPAAKHGPASGYLASENRERLRAAVVAEGWRFAP